MGFWSESIDIYGLDEGSEHDYMGPSFVLSGCVDDVILAEYKFTARVTTAYHILL